MAPHEAMESQSTLSDNRATSSSKEATHVHEMSFRMACTTAITLMKLKRRKKREEKERRRAEEEAIAMKEEIERKKREANKDVITFANQKAPGKYSWQEKSEYKRT